MLKDGQGYPIVPAPHHKLWMELACDESIEKLLIIAPPEAAKTTWMVEAFLGCYVGFYPERSVIISSVSDSVAEARSITLKSTIESPEWQQIFPGVVKNEKAKYVQNEWSIGYKSEARTHPTMRSYGVGSSIIGSRADLLLPDDILDFDNTRTKHQRELVSTWFHNSFLSRKKSKTGRVIMIGTSWNADDLYANIRKEPNGWVICHLPLYNENGCYASVTYAN